MSKKSKALSKQKNLLEKRRRKASNRARYQELRRLGINKKSVRARRNSKKQVRSVHVPEECGNLACNRCYPSYPPFIDIWLK